MALGRLLSRLREAAPRGRLYSSQPPSTPAPRRPRWLWKTIGASTAAGALWYMGRPFGTKEDQPGAAQYPGIAHPSHVETLQTFEEPAFEKLLPDQIIDPQHPRPYTLVIDLDSFLVAHVWDREQGRWRIAKRPGVEQFLFYAAQLYEVVIFSKLPQVEGNVIAKTLDRFGCVSHHLYRFATTYANGGYIKDIGRLNRDLAKVLVLGHDTRGFSPHPESVIPMPEWTGRDASDSALESAIDFLEQVAFSRASDLRPIIKEQREEMERRQLAFPQSFHAAQEEAFERARLSRAATKSARTSSWLFSMLFGGVASTASALKADDPSYEERRAARMQLRQKEYGHIRELMLKQLEAEMEKERAYYAEHKMSMWDAVTRSPSSPPPSTE